MDQQTIDDDLAYHWVSSISGLVLGLVNAYYPLAGTDKPGKKKIIIL